MNRLRPVAITISGFAVLAVLAGTDIADGQANRNGAAVVPIAAQSCQFDVFEDLLPPEVHHTCGARDGRHRALAVCELHNLASPPSGVRHVVEGPWVEGVRTSVAACGVNEKLVDWGAATTG